MIRAYLSESRREASRIATHDKARRGRKSTRMALHRRTLAAAGAALVAAVAAALLISPVGRDLVGVSSSDDTRRAVIVDQLQLTAPNPEFVRDVTDLLVNDGYEVDYVAGKDVTVDVYRELPKNDYGLVILRVHSTAEVSRGEDDVTSVSLFTGQEYSEDLYYEEQMSGAVGFAQYSEDSRKLFGVTADFVRNDMEGRFDDTVVLMMGCQGFINAEGATAFTDKGARTFIGWDGLVSADHTDEATRLLLRHLIQDGAQGRDAVDRTMDEIGPDPDFGSQLLARP
jgi:hypothetical protein